MAAGYSFVWRFFFFLFWWLDENYKESKTSDESCFKLKWLCKWILCVNYIFPQFQLFIVKNIARQTTKHRALFLQVQRRNTARLCSRVFFASLSCHLDQILVRKIVFDDDDGS